MKLNHRRMVFRKKPKSLNNGFTPNTDDQASQLGLIKMNANTEITYHNLKITKLQCPCYGIWWGGEEH